MNMTGTDWWDVRERVAELAAGPDADEVFGVEEHGWLLEPPLSPAELAEVEAQIGVEFPEEYRSFLLQVSRGGAGPAYGLFPLRRVAGRWQWEGGGADLTGLDPLTEPFPHTSAFNPAADLPPQPDEDDFDSEEEFNEAEDRWWEQHDRVAHDPAHSAGAIYLCHYGCALRDMLIVSGPARGTMWSDHTADLDGFSPILNPDGTPASFADWYRRWLDDTERR
ncbi:MAG TPA: SMI1/KNR4 family protein [Micromonosporaceae bacterium]|nr:SMI1/KNR4 family protein [Micromonosporaceae bacterium]